MKPFKKAAAEWAYQIFNQRKCKLIQMNPIKNRSRMFPEFYQGGNGYEGL